MNEAKQIKILVVDDEEDFLDIIRQVLEPHKFDVICLNDGVSVVDVLRKEQPDFMILDVNMPVKNGYEVCREIRQNPEFAELPILMLTIRNQDKEVISGLDCGADDYLTKPFDPAELVARIHKVLKRS